MTTPKGFVQDSLPSFKHQINDIDFIVIKGFYLFYDKRIEKVFYL